MSTGEGWLARCVPSSPLLLKELRVRMRARTVVITDNLYILALCAVVVVSVFLFGNLGEALGWEIGSSLYRFLVYTQSVLMLFVAPLVAASAIVEEKEQKTYDTLRMTPARPGQIVTAKLAAALSCFLMLIMVSLPIASISFILGGVAPVDLIKAYAYTILATVAAGAMGLYWSARFERSIAAIPAASICVVMVLFFGSWLSDGGVAAVASISPLVFLENVFSDGEVPFFGNGCPVWVPSFLFLGFIFAYYVAAVSGRLRFERDRRYVLTRTLALGLFVLLTVFLIGQLASPAEKPAQARQTVASILGGLAALLFAAAPWLGANRPVAQSEPADAAARPRWLRRLLVGGPGFVFIMWLTTLPVLWLALQTVGELKIPVANVWRVHVGVTGPALLVWTLLGAVLAGRTTTRRRFIGMVVAYVLMLVVTVAPFVIGGIIAMDDPDNVPVWVQGVMLVSPISAMGSIADPKEMLTVQKAVISRVGEHGPLIVTGTIYLVALLGIFCLWVRQNRRCDLPPAA